MATICLFWPKALDFVLKELCVRLDTILEDKSRFEASYRVVFRIVKEKKPHTIAGDLSNRALWWNWFVEESKRRILIKIL